MLIPSISGASGAGASGARAMSAQLAGQEFLQLLVTQLRNQDPLSPMSDTDFIAQMAQLSALEATTGLASQVEQLVLAQQQTQALQLVGREVEFVGTNGTLQTGKVESVQFDGGVPMLRIGGEEVSLGWVKAVNG
jgi:flagellar basal-body rod modification protein FlgD